MRAKITIQELLPIRTFSSKNGEVSVYAFKGTDGNKYETFDAKLAPAISGAIGNELDLEWEDTTSADGKYTNHKIKMIYANGQPVIAPKENRGGGGFKPDPEKQASIELQHYTSEVRELLVNGVIETNDPLVMRYFQILHEKLGIPLQSTTQKPPEPVQSTQAASKPPQPVVTPPAKANALQVEAINQLLKDAATKARIQKFMADNKITAKKPSELTLQQAAKIVLQFSEPVKPETADVPPSMEITN